MSAPELGTALLLGILGSAHCLGMCGGLSAALGLTIGTNASIYRRLSLLGLCNLARIAGYVTLGGSLGLIAGLVEGYREAMFGLRMLSALMLVLMGCYLAGFTSALAWLEEAGAGLFATIQTLTRIGTAHRGVSRLLLIGLVWGWLPCGLVYSMLIWAGTRADWKQSAMIMGVFGLGTLPAVLGAGCSAAGLGTLLRKKTPRSVIGIVIVLFGIWTAVAAIAHHVHPPESEHQRHTWQTDAARLTQIKAGTQRFAYSGRLVCYSRCQ